MSSDLKDARWQLASTMAEDDGFDWYQIGYHMKAGYLDAAQIRLITAPSLVPELAEKWRKEQ